MHFVLNASKRTTNDLFESDDELLEIWNCLKCKNHNIDIKKNCSKCNRNKNYHDMQEQQETKQKLKEWHWKCYLCKHENRYLKNDKCEGCFSYSQYKSVSFEVEVE